MVCRGIRRNIAGILAGILALVGVGFYANSLDFQISFSSTLSEITLENLVPVLHVAVLTLIAVGILAVNLSQIFHKNNSRKGFIFSNLLTLAELAVIAYFIVVNINLLVSSVPCYNLIATLCLIVLVIYQYIVSVQALVKTRVKKERVKKEKVKKVKKEKAVKPAK